MKAFQGTTRKPRIAAAALSLAIVAGLLEAVIGGFLYPDPEAMSVRRGVIAAQADQVARARALANGEIKAAATASSPRI